MPISDPNSQFIIIHRVVLDSDFFYFYEFAKLSIRNDIKLRKILWGLYNRLWVNGYCVYSLQFTSPMPHLYFTSLFRRGENKKSEEKRNDEGKEKRAAKNMQYPLAHSRLYKDWRDHFEKNKTNDVREWVNHHGIVMMQSDWDKALLKKRRIKIGLLIRLLTRLHEYENWV